MSGEDKKPSNDEQQAPTGNTGTRDNTPPTGNAGTYSEGDSDAITLEYREK